MQERACYPMEIYPDTLDSAKSEHIQIIIAALNEEEGIAYTIAEFKAILDNPRILIIDGKSSDHTAYVAQSLGATVLFQEGTGKGDALSMGLKSITANANYIVISDADYTYPAGHIPEMIKILANNPQVGMVCGNRFNSEYPLQGMKGVFHIGNKLIATAHSMLIGVNLKDPLTGLRVIRADLLRKWSPTSKDFEIEVELNSYIQSMGFETVEVPIAYRHRVGEKKLKVKHGFKILQRIVEESWR
jgi:dolichol-phosphate hexosyltransferase